MDLVGEMAPVVEPAIINGEEPKLDTVCKYCGCKLTTIHNLKRHVKNQHLGYRYPCARCEAEVSRREDIYIHYERYHPDNMEEAETITEVTKMTEDGRVKPRIRPPYRRRQIRKKRRPKNVSQGAESNETQARKRGRPKKVSVNADLSNAELNTDDVGVSNSDVVDSQTIQTSQGEAENPCSSEPQRVVIALDPVTQFRIERVVAERVRRIIEKSVIETMDQLGHVTRRETIEREYFLGDS